MIKQIAAIIFVAGDEGVSESEICNALSISSADVDMAIQEIKLHLSQDPISPVELVQYGDRYHLITDPELDDAIKKFAQTPLQNKLTRAAIETLAIVAYRQPITRLTVDEIRGVSSASMLHKLLARGLIIELGQLDAPGRPILYGISDYFLNYFGLSSIEELPEIEELALNTQTTTEELFTLKNWTMDSSNDIE